MIRASPWLTGLAWGLLLVISPAWAHKGSDAYLEVQQVEQALATTTAALLALRSYHFVLAVAIKDLDLVLPLDANADGRVTWGEVKTALPSVTRLANEAVKIDASNAMQPASVSTQKPSASTCRLDWKFDGIDRRGDGTYVRLAANG